jgi:hypothetical protein
VALGLEFVAEVGMVVVVDDGDEENLTMPWCVPEVSAVSGNSKVLLVYISNHVRRVPATTDRTGRYGSHVPHHKEGCHRLEESVRPSILGQLG